MLLNCGVEEDSWEPLGLQIDPTSPSWRRSVLGVHWTDWCWSWNSNTVATWCKELTHWKRPWCWEGLGAEGEGDDRGWDGWMASPTQWTWVWVDSGSWWWTGRPGMVRFMGSQTIRHDWVTELTDWCLQPLFFRLFSCAGHYRALSRAPPALQQVLWVAYFIYSRVYMSPQSPNLSLSLLVPLATLHLFSTSVTLFLFYK